LDCDGFACILGGADRKMLFMVTREWHGMERVVDKERTGQVLTIKAPVAVVGTP
jgi:hypothetical protein